MHVCARKRYDPFPRIYRVAGAKIVFLFTISGESVPLGRCEIQAVAVATMTTKTLR